MNQEKIGKFISTCRNEKKLTQEELANNIGVTDKAISKWENGRCLPDVSLFKPLCKNLDITINELLNGERDNKKANEEGYIKYVSYTQNKSKKKIIFTTIFFLLILITIILGTYFINNYGKTTAYRLYGESENFYYNGGLAVFSKDKNILVSSDITIINPDIKEKDILGTTLVCEDEIITSSYMLGFFIQTEDYGYNEMFSDNIIDNINNWYIRVQYVKDNQLITEKIKINNKEEINNNKINYKKALSIGKETKKSKRTDSRYYITEKEWETWNNQKNKLLKEGFEETDDIFTLIKNIKKNDYEEKIKVSIRFQTIYYEKIIEKDKIVAEWNCGTGLKEEIPIEIKLYEEEKIYSYSYSPKTDSLNCYNQECHGISWQQAVEIYNIFQKYNK